VHPDSIFWAFVKFLALQPLTSAHLTDVVELDRRCLGGLWSYHSYQREIDSPNSDLLLLQTVDLADLNSSGTGLADTGLVSTGLADTGLVSTGLAGTDLSSDGPAMAPVSIGLACSWAILDEAHITLLAIDPAYQRQGLGQLLLYSLLVLAWQRGLEWATLEVRVSNQTAISLYQKFGFESVGQRRAYYQDNGEDALILWRKGLQRPEFQVNLAKWQQDLSRRLADRGWHLSTFPAMNWNPATLLKFSEFPLDVG
jgi:[ribosomal protein S18]-alanine N-acetyltransferase